MLSILTPAKINLFLNIRPRREDGFHELVTVYQAVQLWDRLDVAPAAEDLPERLQFTCNMPQLEEQADRNLVVRAYHAFWRRTGLPPMPLAVHLEKNIPLQAGLGGGSSDAAAMLLVLNRLSFEPLSMHELSALAAELGSDVPFFLTGGTALGQGRGERIEPVPRSLHAGIALVIVKPRYVSIDTAAAYRRYARDDHYEPRSPEHLLSALARDGHKDMDGLLSYLHNDFEKVLFEEYPVLLYVRNALRECGVMRPMVSGSGSALFGFIDDRPELRRRVMEKFRPDHYRVFWTATHNGGVRQMGS